MSVPKPIVMHLPMADETIDRITKHRLERTHRLWRWDTDDKGLAGFISGLPREAADAVIAARQEVFLAERAVVVAVLDDTLAVGRLVAEEADEQ
jgi:hypothetical protein